MRYRLVWDGDHPGVDPGWAVEVYDENGLVRWSTDVDRRPGPLAGIELEELGREQENEARSRIERAIIEWVAAEESSWLQRGTNESA